MAIISSQNFSSWEAFLRTSRYPRVFRAERVAGAWNCCGMTIGVDSRKDSGRLVRVRGVNIKVTIFFLGIANMTPK